MNLATLYLSLALGVGLYPRLVDAYDVQLSLFDPRSTSLLDQFFGDEDPFDSISSLMRRQEQAFDRAFSSLRGSHVGGFLDYGRLGLPSIRTDLFSSSSSSSPSYEVVDDKESFTVNVHLPPTVQPNDVNIQVDEQSRQLTISGHQESKNEETGYLFSSSFSRSFPLGPFVQADQMTATVKVQKKDTNTEDEAASSDVILQVSAPKDVDRMEHAVRSIPIAPYATTATLPAAEGDNALDDSHVDDSKEVVMKPAVAAVARAAAGVSEKEQANVSHVLKRIEKNRQQKRLKSLLTNKSDAISQEEPKYDYKVDPKNPNARLTDRAKNNTRKSELRRRR